MVIGLWVFHTLGIVGLLQDCEQGGGRILGPREDSVSAAAERCLSPSSAPRSLPRQRPGISFITPVRFLKGSCSRSRPRAGSRGAGWDELPPSSRTPASSLLGAIRAAATLTVPQDQHRQPWKKPTMEGEVEYGWCPQDSVSRVLSFLPSFICNDLSECEASFQPEAAELCRVSAGHSDPAAAPGPLGAEGWAGRCSVGPLPPLRTGGRAASKSRAGWQPCSLRDKGSPEKQAELPGK